MPFDFEGRDLGAIEIHIPGLRRYARLLVRGDLDRADDLVEEALKRVLSRDRRRGSGGDPRVPLYAILHRRLSRRSETPSASEGAGDDLSGIDGGTTRFDGHIDLMRGFSRLPDDERSVLYLVGVEDFSYGEAATILGVPVEAVIAKLMHGRECLRQYCNRIEPAQAKASPAIAR